MTGGNGKLSMQGHILFLPVKPVKPYGAYQIIIVYCYILTSTPQEQTDNKAYMDVVIKKCLYSM